MKTSSAKAKGRRLQQRVRDDLRTVAGSRLDPTDIESTIMGVSGVDVVLTKAAKGLFGPLAFECKNVEILNAIGVFQKHYDKYAAKGMVPIMVHSRNHIEPRVTMLWSDFVKLYLAPAVEIPKIKNRLDALDSRVNETANLAARVTAKSPLFAAPYGSRAHVTRMSDSSLYDEVCKVCGITDGQAEFNQPCPGKSKV